MNNCLFFSALALHVKPCLEKLSQDVDHDVQYFASEAFDSECKTNKLSIVQRTTIYSS